MDVTSTVDTRLNTLATLHRLDCSEVTTIVRRTLEDDRVEVDAWDVQARSLGFASAEFPAESE